jgi:succinate dehydrogenase / fumarate reductase cytochrome b subunit
MWSWVLHRITGIAIYFFLLVHVLDTATVRLDPEIYNSVMGSYKTPLMGLVDTTKWGTRYQKVMFYVVLGLWVALMAAFLPRHLMHVFGG